MHDTDIIPEIQSKGVKERTFSKNRRQRSCPLLRSLSIVDDPDFWGTNFSLSMKKNITPYTSIFPKVSVKRPTSVIQGGVGGRGRGGGEGRTSFANWEPNGPCLLRNVSHAQKENQRPHMEEILPKLKIMYKEMGPLPRSLWIADDQDL